MSDAPKPTGKPAANVNLTGKLIPWMKGQPVLISIAGSRFEYLPCFSSEQQLRDFMEGGAGGPIPFGTVKQITDGREFLTSFGPEHLKVMRVILDPHAVEGGKIRWTEILPD